MSNSNKKNIFTKKFNGSIDDLLKFTNEAADFVENVLFTNKEKCNLTEEESRAMIKEELHIDDEELISKILDEIYRRFSDELLQYLLSKNYVRVKRFENGEPIFEVTPEGKAFALKDKNTIQ